MKSFLEVLEIPKLKIFSNAGIDKKILS